MTGTIASLGARSCSEADSPRRKRMSEGVRGIRDTRDPLNLGHYRAERSRPELWAADALVFTKRFADSFPVSRAHEWANSRARFTAHGGNPAVATAIRGLWKIRRRACGLRPHTPRGVPSGDGSRRISCRLPPGGFSLLRVDYTFTNRPKPAIVQVYASH